MAERGPVPPGAFDAPLLAPVYVGGMPLDDLVAALAINTDILAASRQTADAQFWSTPRRKATDPTREIFEVNLSVPKKVNAISFDLPRFPHKAYLFYLNTKTKKWAPMLNTSRKAMVVNVVDSIPATIIPAPPGSNTHAQHYGAGHWVTHTYTINPITAASFRVVLVRQKTGREPVDHARKAVPYSLGVRDFNIGYKVAGYKNIPKTARDPVIVTERTTFSSTTDLLGSPVTISVRENRATDLLRGALWKSEPQPVPNAVVNLYVDARDSAGNPQVVDRFLVDPITNGVHVNVYYATQMPDVTTFPARDDPLGFPLTRQVGAEVIARDVGLVFSDDIGYLDIDNAAPQFDPTKAFWLGLVIAPQFDSADTTEHILVDTGTLCLRWNGSALLATLFGVSITRDDIPFTVNQSLSLVFAFDGNQIFFYSQGDEHLNPTPLEVVEPSPTTSIRLGGLQTGDDGDPGHGKFVLASLILKTEPPPSQDTYEQYFADPTEFVVEAEFASDDQGTSDNAILRYDPTFQTVTPGSVNQFGFVGGPGSQYEDLVWTPVARDFKLNKGYLVFNATKASVFKFEFTNLAAMPYDDYEPMVRKVKVFPTAQYYAGVITPPPTASGNTSGGGAIMSQSASYTLHYADQVRLYTNVQIAQKDGSYAPTAALYSQSPLVQGRLRENSLYFNLQAWHLSKFIPRFVEVQKHVYEHIEIEHTKRLAYFVGLNSLSMLRVDYAVSDDTEQYLEWFHDSANLADPGSTPGWIVSTNNATGGYLVTPDEIGVSDVFLTSSKIFTSQRKVTGLQFAAQQTPATQLLDDPDFTDRTLVSWRVYGDAAISPNTDFTSDIGSMVKVERNAASNYWNVMEERWDSWDAITASSTLPDHPVWDELEAQTGALTDGGVQAAQQYDLSSIGRAYAAARVYVTEPLNAPLYVQIVDADGTVLAEEPFTPAANQVAEWYCSYTIGEGGALVDLDWDGMEVLGSWDDLEALGSWDQVDTTSAVLVGGVSARVIQNEPTDDVWYVDNLSLFDDGIIWEFSNDFGAIWWPVYDIRCDPHGAFMFPEVDDPKAGLGFSWRVRGVRAKQQVHHLAIRPLYDSLPLGQPYRETMQSVGPNESLIDHYPPIVDDPLWKLWHKPIPEDWWFVFRQWLLFQEPDDQAMAPRTVVPDSISMVDEGNPSTPLYIDTVVLVPFDQDVPLDTPMFDIDGDYVDNP